MSKKQPVQKQKQPNVCCKGEREREKGAGRRVQEKEKEMEKEKQKHEQKTACQEAEATKRMLQQMQNYMKHVTHNSCFFVILS